MSVARELLQLLAPLGDTLPVPPIARLCVPPDRPEADKGGEFLAVELQDGSIGLAFALLDGALTRIGRGVLPEVLGLAPTLLMRDLAWGEAPNRVLLMACANAVSQWLFRVSGMALEYRIDSLAELAFVPGDRAGMVGYFPPLVDRLRGRGIDLTVLELKRELVREGDRFRVTTDPSALSSCNKVLCTSTVLLNDSFDQALSLCRDAVVAVVGPGAGMIPDPLFARGVSTLGGIRIEQAEEFRRRCGRGESWGGTGRKYCIRRAAYPGLATLVAAAQRSFASV